VAGSDPQTRRLEVQMTEKRNQHTDAHDHATKTSERPDPREEDGTSTEPLTPFEPHEGDDSPLGDTDQHSDA
jgi:hypothetical protein